MQMENTFLLIVGAPKCGTTSLANWLSQHPKFILSEKKEPGFFLKKPEFFIRTSDGTKVKPTWLVNTLEEYYSMFEVADPEKILVDASTNYLSDPEAPERIAAFARDHRVKVMCVTRDPIDRAFSQYKHAVRDGKETESFLRSLELEETRRAQGYSHLFAHVNKGRYAEQINRFRRVFPDMVVMGFTELRNPSAVIRRVEELVGLEAGDDHPIDFQIRNESKIYKSRFGRKVARSRKLARLIDGLTGRRGVIVRGWIDAALTRRIALDPEAIRFIYGALRDDIEHCLADPEIPTSEWSTTLEARERAASSIGEYEETA